MKPKAVPKFLNDPENVGLQNLPQLCGEFVVVWLLRAALGPLGGVHPKRVAFPRLLRGLQVLAPERAHRLRAQVGAIHQVPHHPNRRGDFSGRHQSLYFDHDRDLNSSRQCLLDDVLPQAIL